MQFSRFIKTIVCAAVTVCALDARAEEQTKQSANEKPKITISKETTYITEPLRPDGYPDYVAAINQRASEGITPENNGAVLLLKALGPSILLQNARKDTLRQLGIDDLPDAGEYIVDQKEAIKRWRAKQPQGAQLASDTDLDDQFDRAQEEPWSDDEYPAVAFWMSVNAAPLELAVQGIERPKFYFPYVEGGEGYPPAISMLVPMAQESRQVARLLATRAMRELKRGKVQAAWQDLSACHRLSRHIASGQCLVELLVGFAIDSIAIQGDIVVSHYGSLSVHQARQMQAELQRLPELASAVDKIDTCERYVYLDAVAHVARVGTFAAWQKMIGLIVALSSDGHEAKQSEATQLQLTLPKISWDLALKAGNSWYDRMAESGRESDPRARHKALQALNDDLHLMSEGARKSFSYTFLTLMLTGLLPAETSGQFMAKAFPSLLLPATTACFRAEDRLRLMARMDETAFALAAYRADHTQYPEELGALAPKYLSQIPDDTFAETPTPIRYRREGDAY